MYSAGKIAELKEELKKRGASLRGRKADLVERLDAYDQYFNAQPNTPCAIDEDPAMQLPSPDMYRDINSNTNVAPINKTQIRHYLNFTSKKMQKAVDLYESRHLVAVRSYNLNGDTYIKSICRKTMKQLYYESNIKMDQFGTVDEATCGCPAGSGTKATCKHVAIVLLALEQLRTRKNILLYQTCTQKLQQFHVPKKTYTGTPVRAEKMARRSKTASILFEPYTVQNIDRNTYNSRIRSLVQNYPNTTMPLKQMFEPANAYALVADHTYCRTHAPEETLRKLHISQIDDEVISHIEGSTRLQADSPEWHEERKKRITASKYHTICHLKETTKKSYASQMMNQREFTSRATTHGKINENIAINTYAATYELDVQSCGLFVSAERPYLAASPDVLLGSETVIEVKCPYASRMKLISNETVPYLYEKDGNLNLKETSPYYYQIQGQMYCTGRKYANLIVYTFMDMKIIYVTRDNKFITYMLLKLDEFYENYFKCKLLEKHLHYSYENYKK